MNPETEVWPSLGSSNTFTLFEKDGNVLKLFCYDKDPEPGQFTEKASTALPEGYHHCIYQHITPSGQIYVNAFDRQDVMHTLVYNRELHLIRQFLLEGDIIGIGGDRLVCTNRPVISVEQKDRVTVRDVETRDVLLELDLPTSYVKLDWPRACVNPEQKKVAIVARKQKRLDIFGPNGTLNSKWL